MSFDNGLFIFRRDLRIVDNTALNLINSKCNRVFTIFIFTNSKIIYNYLHVGNHFLLAAAAYIF